MSQHIPLGIAAHRAVVAVVHAYAGYFQKLRFKVFGKIVLIILLKHRNAVIGLVHGLFDILTGHAKEG